MVAGVAGPVARILAEVQADQILERTVENPGGRLRVQLHKDAVDFAVDGRRVGGVDAVANIIVVSAFHFLACVLNLHSVDCSNVPLIDHISPSGKSAAQQRRSPASRPSPSRAGLAHGSAAKIRATSAAAGEK